MNKRNLALSLTAFGAMVVLSACATKPQPAEELPIVEAPPPVFQEMEPQEQPVQQPVQQPVAAPALDLPPPGSLADFAYQSGGEPRVFFGYNKYDLNNDAREALRRQAQWLQTYSNTTAIVEGNADERGTREYNLALAARRADSVKAFLVSQGVNPARLTTVSYGKERPIDGGSNEAAWARNRNGHTNINSGAIG